MMLREQRFARAMNFNTFPSQVANLFNEWMKV
jgi:hypothetical protein